MNSIITYGIIFVILLLLELAYFKIADKFNIIDKPNERSSHSAIVLRGGGIIFLLGAWVWALKGLMVDGLGFMDCYPFFLVGLTLVAGVSFIDDIHSLPDSARLVVQFTAAALAFYQLGLFEGFNVSEGFTSTGLSTGALFQGVIVPALIVLMALIVYVGATNVINFMDGINGITAGYSLAVLIPIALLNKGLMGEKVNGLMVGSEDFNPLTTEGLNPLTSYNFFDQSLLIVSILSVLVFCLFNFRPKGKAKCFAGDVGSIGVAFIMLFLIGKVIIATGDLSYLIFLLVYGVDGVLTICHRIMLHENLGEAHRKHAYQLMANELKIGHVKVSLLYMTLQLIVSLGFIYVCPLLETSLGISLVLCHWIYLIGSFVVLASAYVAFKKKYYHLHEEYLASLKK